MQKIKPWENTEFWNDIDTVLLDMDGTLLDLYFDNYFWKIALPAAYSQKLGDNEPSQSYQYLSQLFSDKAGTLDWYCLDFWEGTLDIDIMSLKKEYAHLIAYRPGVVEFLDFLVEKNIKPVLVTNAHRKSLELKLLSCPLTHWIKHIYSSHDFGLPKEDHRFWLDFSKKHIFDTTKTVFIDDNESVLKSAKAFGIKHLFSIEYPDSGNTLPNKSSFPQINHFKNLITQ